MRSQPILLALILFVMIQCLDLQACMQSSDLFRATKIGLPPTSDIIVGGFERNPPEYYEKRLEIAYERIDKDPKNFNAYDDIATAKDSLGDSREAMAWMERKRGHLADDAPTWLDAPTDWYRYHANLGTFMIHAWIREGSKPEDLDLALQAIKHIEKGIEINPDAHFGREIYQLMAMRSLVANAQGNPPKFIINPPANKREEAIIGVAGMMTLGAAWNSPDMMLAMAHLQRETGNIGGEYLALRRLEEILDSGMKPLLSNFPENPSSYIDSKVRSVHRSQLKVSYIQLKSRVELWHTERTKQLHAKLAAGSHPDKDDDFYDGMILFEGIKEIQALSSTESTLEYYWITRKPLLFSVAALLLLVFVILPIQERLSTSRNRSKSVAKRERTLRRGAVPNGTA